MLERAVVRRLEENENNVIDIGRLLDSALYYGKINIILENGILESLIRAIGADGLYSLVSNNSFIGTLTLSKQTVIAQSNAGIESYTPAAYALYQNTPRSATKIDPVDSVRQIFSHPNSRIEISIPEAKRIVASCRIRPGQALLGEENSTCAIWKSLSTDPNIVRNAINSVAHQRRFSVNQSNLKSVDLSLNYSGQSVKVDSSVDLQSIVVSPSDENPVFWIDVFKEIERYRTDIVLSQDLKSDLIVDDSSHEMSLFHIESVLKNSLAGQRNIDQFESAVFQNGRTIGDAYNLGGITLSEALRVIDRAARFKKFLHQKPFDANLLREYIAETSGVSSLSKFPGRELKFLCMQGLNIFASTILPGVGGVLVGAGLGAAETFILPNLERGWKPNLFVADVQREIRRRPILE